MWWPTRTRVVRALVACALVCATAFAGGADGATSSVVVTADIPSASTLINGCTSAAATQFGSVLPDTGSRTATGIASVCRLTFGSSNNTSQLRISQKDGLGAAMGIGIEPPTLLTRANQPGRSLGAFGYDSSLAWTVGRSQTAFRTVNGGSSWIEFGVGAAGDNFDVEAVPGLPDTWWLVGENRKIYRTVDGQVATPTWASMAAQLTAAGWPASIDINELTIPDNDTIVIVGESRWIGVYDISAGTWTAFQHSNAAIGNLVAVDSWDANTFIAVSSTGTVIWTTTKGLNSAAWSVASLPGTPTVSDVAFATNTRAYAVGDDGYVAAWNGSWTDLSATLGAAIDLTGVDVKPTDPDTALVSDEYGGVFRTSNGGAAWTHRGMGNGSRTGDIHYATAGGAVYVAAAERKMTASQNGGTTWASWTSVLAEALSDVAASPVNGERLLAVGLKAWRSTNGGTAWTSATTGVTQAMHGVSLANDTQGWAVGEGATILRTNDQGATWTQQAAPAGVTEDLTDVTALDPYHAVAVGHGGTIVRTVNGGSSWTSVASGTTRMLTGVDGVGDQLVAVGARGTVLRSTDAGATWTPIGGLPDPVLNLSDVDFSSPAVGYIAVSYDDVLRTGDGGLTWSQVAGGTATTNRAISAEGSTVVVVGLNDQIARSTNQGATFQQTFGPTGLHLNGVAGIDPHRAVIVGPDQLRYEMDATPGVNATVPDWSAPANDWDSGGFFGVCLQAVGGGAFADWTADATGVVGECETNGVDPWRALPATGSLAAHTTAAGLGTVDLVWGFRPKTNQLPGTYEAGVAFEAISP